MCRFAPPRSSTRKFSYNVCRGPALMFCMTCICETWETTYYVRSMYICTAGLDFQDLNAIAATAEATQTKIPNQEAISIGASGITSNITNPIVVVLSPRCTVVSAMRQNAVPIAAVISPHTMVASPTGPERTAAVARQIAKAATIQQQELSSLDFILFSCANTRC